LAWRRTRAKVMMPALGTPAAPTDASVAVSTTVSWVVQ
jgi:hypothetical protein